MAEYSRQYMKLVEDTEFSWDFDIEDEFKKLEKGYYKSLICEGFGFFAIGLDNVGEKLLFTRDPHNWEMGDWINYDKFVEEFLEKKRKQVVT